MNGPALEDFNASTNNEASLDEPKGPLGAKVCPMSKFRMKLELRMIFESMKGAFQIPIAPTELRGGDFSSYRLFSIPYEDPFCARYFSRSPPRWLWG